MTNDVILRLHPRDAMALYEQLGDLKVNQIGPQVRRLHVSLGAQLALRASTSGIPAPEGAILNFVDPKRKKR